METPFGTDTGGVHPAMFDVKPEARYDSWLTFNQDDGENKDKIKYVRTLRPRLLLLLVVGALPHHA